MTALEPMKMADFLWKLGVSVIPLLLFLLWISVRSVARRGYLLSGLTAERELVLSGDVPIGDLQNGNWSANASQAMGLAGVALATLVVSTTLVLQMALDEWRRAFLIVILLVLGLTTLTYAFALQFWNQALDRGLDLEWLLLQRKIATLLQVGGWFGLYFSTVLAVALVSGWCGVLLSMVGAFALVVVYEVKGKARRYESRRPRADPSV